MHAPLIESFAKKFKIMKLHPVVLEHAAAFIGRSPWDVSRDASLLAAAEIAAFQAYGHQPLICGIDVYNVEAEAWGARVEESGLSGVLLSGVHSLMSLLHYLNSL